MSSGGLVMHQNRGTYHTTAGVAASSVRSCSSSSSTNRVFPSTTTTTTTTTSTTTSTNRTLAEEEEEDAVPEMLDLNSLDADSDCDYNFDYDTGGDDGHHKQQQRRRTKIERGTKTTSTTSRRRQKNGTPLLVALSWRLYHLTINHMINYATATSSRYQHRHHHQRRLSSNSGFNNMKKKTVRRITTILGMSLFTGLFIILSLTSQQLHIQIRRQQMEASISSSSSSSSLIPTTGREGAEDGLTDNGWSTSLTRTGLVATILGTSSFDVAIPKILSSIYSSGAAATISGSVSTGHGRNLLRKSSLSTPPKSSRPQPSSTKATSTTSNSPSSNELSFSSSSRSFFSRRRLNKRFNNNISKNKRNRSYIDERGLRYLALGGQAFVAMGQSSSTSSTGDQSSSNSNNYTRRRNHKEESYPALLSQNVRTVSPAGRNEIADDDDDEDDDDDNPTLASLCTQSMIGDENIYDVITIQYQTAHSATKDDAASSSLSAVGLLLERLRQRFPDSTIVFVDVWSPLDAYYYDDKQRHSRNKVSFEQWRSKIIKEEKDSEHGSVLLSKHFKDHEWLLDDEGEARRNEMEGIVEAIGGILYRLPRSSINDADNGSRNDISQAIMDWFIEYPRTETNNDIVVNGHDKKSGGILKYSLSPKAHAVIAADLESIVRRSIEMAPAYSTQGSSTGNHAIATFTTSSDGLTSSSPRVGTWGSGDSCQLWYEAGNAIPSQFSQGLSFVELATPSFDSKRGSKNKESRRRALSSSSSSSEPTGYQRYALEVTSASDNDQVGNDSLSSSYLQVHNPFEEDRMLYLTYLTTSATSSSRKVYPRTKIQLRHGTSSIPSGTVVLDPSHDDNSDEHHHTRTSAVGTVPAGQSSTIYFTPLEEYTESSFRVVGASFLAKEKLSHRISSDFNLSPHGITMKVDDSQDDDETQN